MLPTHGRYEYSNITKRPDYAWPGGRRLAVYVALNIEAFGFGVGKGAAIAPPDQAQSHSVYSWRDYGNRVGIWRLFELLDELGIPAQAQMNTSIYEMAPDIPERLRARGDEILGHGVTNSDEQGHLGEDEERALIESVTATIARHEGARPAGWMSPWLSNSAVTMDLLQEAGYRYAMDWTMDDQPIWIKTRKGRILAMPYPIEVNDTRGIVWYRYTADQFADMIVDQFDEMLEQSARQPLVCPISLHPFVTGRPYRIRRLRQRAPAHPRAPGSRVADAPARHLRPHRVAARRRRARQSLTGRGAGCYGVGFWNCGRPVCAVRPPSATIAAPVMKDASSEARKRTVLAISSASPTRPIGWAAAYTRRSSSARSRPRICVARVSMKPGHTQLTRMLCRAFSIAAERVRLMTPAFAAL